MCVETLPLRIERHSANALALAVAVAVAVVVAKFLQADKRVGFVNYPGLEDHRSMRCWRVR